MKTTITNILLGASLLIACVLLVRPSRAVTAEPVTVSFNVAAVQPPADLPPASPIVAAKPESPAEKPDVIAETVAGIAAKYPILVTILTIIGGLRAVFKPLVSWYEARVAETADDTDDARLAKWKSSWWFKALAWGLDFGASIKVGVRK